MTRRYATGIIRAMPPPSTVRPMVDSLIQNAGRDGVSATELLRQVQAQVPHCSVPHLNRILRDLRERDRRIVRRWEWVETGPVMGSGYRTYRYWGVNFYMDATTAPVCRTADGTPVVPPPVLLKDFHPQVEM